MTPNQPPRVATWMLKHLGSGPDNEALLGDLAEQYLEKNSAVWYWRQAMKAIPVTFFREVRGHKQTAAGALLTGWVLWILGGALIFPLVFYGTNVGFEFDPRHPIGSALSFMFMPVLGPASIHQPVSFVFATALPLIVGTISGWLVAGWQICVLRNPWAIRVSAVHRDRQTGIVLLFAGSILLMDLLLSGSLVFLAGPPVAYSFAGPLAANVAASVAGVVVGGGLLRERAL